jgi:hypothetical protein
VKVAATTIARTSGIPRAASIGSDVYVAYTEQAPAKRVRVAQIRF